MRIVIDPVVTGALTCLLVLIHSEGMSQQAAPDKQRFPPANAKEVFSNEDPDTHNFDEGWRFHAGGFQGAEETDMEDSAWRRLDLPHDWSIEDIPGTGSPFDPGAVNQTSGGFTRQGTGWYRKTFTLPAADRAKKIFICFEGVYMNSDVYINGKHLGNHPYGYTSFYYDISRQVQLGKKNVIAVEVKNEGQNSRWYPGSGIYRHVWLRTVDPVHIAQWGTYITTPSVDGGTATVHITSRVDNESEGATGIRVVTRLLDAAGVEKGRVETGIDLAAGGRGVCQQEATVLHPQLWSCESPVLYKAVTAIYRDGKLLNEVITPFGIRTIRYDTANGFQLNGKTVKLKGGCFHLDNGPLGSKAYDRAEERKVQLLKANGFNAIRCSHNPPSPAFLDACDREGILVMDEAFDMWNEGKNPYDYHLYFRDWWQRDIESMVTRDRNHPSIILWSIGNEIPEKETYAGIATAGELAKYVRQLDPTRAVTSAVNALGPDKDPYFATLDIAGYNYAAGGYPEVKDLYELDHARVPGRIMVGTESYALDAFQAWMAVEDHSYVIGDFVWTAWDYIGEASIGWLGYPQENSFYPWNLAYCGDIDLCGWKRPQSYYRDVLWKRDQLSLFVQPLQSSFPGNLHKADWSRWNWLDAVPEWNWEGQEGKPMKVSVYSSCEKVELFLNGLSLGMKPTNRSTIFMADWSVPYQAGELKAVGYRGNVIVQRSVLATAGAPVGIKLTADRRVLCADGQDLSYITVELADLKGLTDPRSEKLLHFELIGEAGKAAGGITGGGHVGNTGDGPGVTRTEAAVTGVATIAGVGNGNPMSLESFQLPWRKTWKGKCLVIVKAGHRPGHYVLRATGEGLPAAEISLDVQ